MAGRMSPLHVGNALTGGLTPGQSIPPVSRNGGASNSAVNGASVDLRGKRGAYFVLTAGALTGAANYLAYLQTADKNHDGDLANATWANVNTTTYPNASIAVKTNANAVFGMSYDPAVVGFSGVRAVLVADANISIVGVDHITF